MTPNELAREIAVGTAFSFVCLRGTVKTMRDLGYSDVQIRRMAEMASSANLMPWDMSRMLIEWDKLTRRSHA